MTGVVMLLNDFAPVSGGAEKQAQRLAEYLTSRGWEVFVITRRHPGLPPSQTMNGYSVIRPFAWGPGKLKTISFIIGVIWNLWCSRREYLILHAHMLFGPAFAAVLIGRLLRKRVIVKLGSSGPDGEIQTSTRTLRGRIRLAFLRRWADVIVTLDDAMFDEALAAGFQINRIRRMVNGINTASFESVMSKDDSKKALGIKDRTIILFVGRLVSQKSLPTLLRAFSRSIIDCPELFLVLVGDGPEYAALVKLADELQIGEDMLFAGNQPDVKRYLHAADLFVLPSESEGMSNALMEAMASGLPCIATPVGASPSLLAFGDCGILAPVGDEKGLANVLIELARNPNRRLQMGNAARKRVIAEYDFSVVGSRYEALYRELELAGHI